jgi:RecB family endonuclease NucS
VYGSNNLWGVEFPIDGGRIDILAVDRNKQYVVIELKVSRGRNKTLGQLLHYMGWVDKNLGKGTCRGIVIAKEISEDLALAVSRASGVALYRYNLNVDVKRVA